MVYREEQPPVRSCSTGFTMVELLLVVAILGIVIAAVAPRMGGLLEGGQISVGARAVAQAGRYARSMALMYQLPMELVLELDQGNFSVEAASSTGAAGDAADSDMHLTEGGGDGAVSFGKALSRNERMDETQGLGLRSKVAEIQADEFEPLAGEGVRDELAVRRELDGVRLEFLGYSDRTDMTDGEVQEHGSIRVRYRANGTCRPYKVAVVGLKTDERFVIEVDAVGTPQLEHGRQSGGRRR